MMARGLARDWRGAIWCSRNVEQACHAATGLHKHESYRKMMRLPIIGSLSPFAKPYDN